VAIAVYWHRCSPFYFFATSFFYVFATFLLLLRDSEKIGKGKRSEREDML
jgi:hypothetical protein